MPTARNPRDRSAASSRPRRRDGSSSQSRRKSQASKRPQARKARSQGDGSTGSIPTSSTDRVRSNGAVGYTSAANVRSGGRRRPAHGAHAAPTKKGFPVWGVIIILLVVAGMGVGGFFLVRHLVHPYEGTRVEDGQEVQVVIPEGSSGADIIQILLDTGVIHSSKDFRKAAQEQHADQSLRPGTYTFVTGSDPGEVVAQLVIGPNSSEGVLQIPEGLTLVQTAKVVESSLGISQDDFVKQAKASNYANDYTFLSSAGNDSLEGFLYPKTYDLSGKEVTADAVIRLMLDQYQTEVQGLDLTGAETKLADRYNLNVTDYDILKIASIIEKEAINADDRAKVSSVFYNRLSAGQMLESDATMSYETGGAVSADDLQNSTSAYNTYKHKGLPPTPICSPSLWAIEAAMEPADTSYYFFFIIEDGVYSNHTFSETYDEHSEAYTAALNEQAAANGTTTEAASEGRE